MQSLSDENEFGTLLPEPSSKGAKRGHQIEREYAAKRTKVDQKVHKYKRQQVKTMPNKSLPEDTDSYIDLVKLGDETESAAVEDILVPDVGISDFCALSKHEGLSNIIHSPVRFSHSG